MSRVPSMFCSLKLPFFFQCAAKDKMAFLGFCKILVCLVLYFPDHKISLQDTVQYTIYISSVQISYLQKSLAITTNCINKQLFCLKTWSRCRGNVVACPALEFCNIEIFQKNRICTNSKDPTSGSYYCPRTQAFITA